MQDSRRQHVVPYTERVHAEACGNIELTFYDLLDQLHTGHDAPGVEEALEAEHFHQIVVRLQSNETGKPGDLVQQYCSGRAR